MLRLADSLEPSKHDLDVIAAFTFSLVVFDCFPRMQTFFPHNHVGSLKRAIHKTGTDIWLAKGADVVLSMNVVAWNSAIAGGGLLGTLSGRRSSWPLENHHFHRRPAPHGHDRTLRA